MTTHYRENTSGDEQTFMMTSHSTLPGLPLDDDDKDKFLELLIRFATGYFVAVHEFVIMGKHFHLKLSLLKEEAATATPEDILARHKDMWGKKAVLPNSGMVDGVRTPDEDVTGVTRGRKRLSDPARFMQVLKQTFARYYNKKNNRKGYFWDSRYHSVPLYEGLARMAAGAYVATNAIKAAIASCTDGYKWCTDGLKKKRPDLWSDLITPAAISHHFVEEYLPLAVREKDYDVSLEELMGTDKGRRDFRAAYIKRVLHGEYAVHGSDVDPRIIASVNSMDNKLNIQKFNKTGARNLTRGVAVGSYDMILAIQENTGRTRSEPRALMDGGGVFATRRLK